MAGIMGGGWKGLRVLVLFHVLARASAGGTVSINIKDLGAIEGIQSLDIRGNYDGQLSKGVSGKASYVFNKDRVLPAGLSASSSTDTAYGKAFGTVTVDPQEKDGRSGRIDPERGARDVFDDFEGQREGGRRAWPVEVDKQPGVVSFALQEATPMVIAIAHDINTKEGHLSIAAKLNSNFDGKLMLPSQGDPVATLVGSHSPDKASDIRASANVLHLVGSGFGKGAIGVTYRRDLDAVAGSSSRVTLEGKDTGDFAWSLSNTSKRMTLVLSGRGRVARRGAGTGVGSTVSLRQSFRMF